MISDKFLIVGSIFAVLGGLQYLFDTIRGKAKPNRITWILWTIFPMMAFAAQLSNGSGSIAYLSFVSGFTPLLIVIASMLNKKAYWQTTRLDYVCMGLAILGAMLWILTKNPNMAIVFSIVADACAAAPTVVKAYKHPTTESAPAFMLSSIGFGIGLLTIHNWVFNKYAFVLYLFIVNFLIFALAKFKVGVRVKNI